MYYNNYYYVLFCWCGPIMRMSLDFIDVMRTKQFMMFLQFKMKFFSLTVQNEDGPSQHCGASAEHAAISSPGRPGWR